MQHSVTNPLPATLFSVLGGPTWQRGSGWRGPGGLLPVHPQSACVPRWCSPDMMSSLCNDKSTTLAIEFTWAARALVALAYSDDVTSSEHPCGTNIAWQCPLFGGITQQHWCATGMHFPLVGPCWRQGLLRGSVHCSEPFRVGWNINIINYFKNKVGTPISVSLLLTNVSHLGIRTTCFNSAMHYSILIPSPSSEYMEKNGNLIL